MIEIIPNGHPIFEHFTVALFSAAVGFYWLSFIVGKISYLQPTLSQEFETVGRKKWVIAMPLSKLLRRKIHLSILRLDLKSPNLIL